MRVYTIIPSGGLGKRAGSPLPKQYVRFNGKELIAYTLEIFQKCRIVDSIIVAAQKEFFPLLESIKSRYSLSKLELLIEGGSERQYSVSNALKQIPLNSDNIIVVHDAVRPMLDIKVLESAIECAKMNGSAVVAVRAKDTLVKAQAKIEEYLDREKVYYIQTPQIFQQKILVESMERANKDSFLGTDESMLVKRAGYEINIVDGSVMNFKITTDDDMKLFELISASLGG